VIDIDDDSEDVVIIGEKVNNSNKGKTIDAVHDDHQVVVCIRFIFCCFLRQMYSILSNMKITDILLEIIFRKRLIILTLCLVWKILDQLVGLHLLTIFLQCQII